MSQASIPIIVSEKCSTWQTTDSFTISFLKNQLMDTQAKLNQATTRINELQNENYIYRLPPPSPPPRTTPTITTTKSTSTTSTTTVDDVHNENAFPCNIESEIEYMKRQDIDRVKLTNLCLGIVARAEEAFISTLNASRHYPGDQSVLCRLQ